MKIAQINTTYGVADSTGRAVKEMHEWLLQHALGSTVYCAGINDGSVPVGVTVYISHKEQLLHGLQSRITGKQGYYSKKATKNLILSLSKDKPDIVLMRVLHSNCLHFPLLMNWLSRERIATVLVMDDCWYFTGHCTNFLTADCRKWEKECHNCPQMRRDNCSWFLDTSRACFRDKKRWAEDIPCLGVVGVSDWITDIVRKSFLKNADEVRRIYNWIDRDVFHPGDPMEARRKCRIPGNKTILLAVSSRWTEEKGISTLLSVAEDSRDYQLYLIGEWDNKPAGLPENICCVGTVRELEKMSDYYNAADVFLNPSSVETFGKTTAEAICCGTAIVAYRTSATTELVEKAGGSLVAPGNVDGFCREVRRIASEKRDPGNRSKAMEFAAAELDKDRNIGAYLELFEALLKEKNEAGFSDR